MAKPAEQSRSGHYDPAIDTVKALRYMDAKIAATSNERHKRHLATVREHMYYEQQLDPEGVMGTLSPKANYKLWINGKDLGAKGIHDIREWYVNTNIRKQRTFVIEYDLERVIVDDDVVVTEGQMNLIVDAGYANEYFGLTFGPDDILLNSFRQVVFWPMDENSKLLGEDFYVTGQENPQAWRKLAPHEVHEDWYALVRLSKEI